MIANICVIKAYLLTKYVPHRSLAARVSMDPMRLIPDCIDIFMNSNS